MFRSAKQQWKSVGPLLSGSIVYLDAGGAEAVGASVGVAFLQSEQHCCALWLIQLAMHVVCMPDMTPAAIHPVMCLNRDGQKLLEPPI